MERPKMDESNGAESPEPGEVAPQFFVYNSETRIDDIPKETLTHLRVDSSVSEIPNSVFSSCHALVHLQLPVTLTRIRDYAFYECYNLKRVQFASGNDSLDASSVNPTLEEGTVVFPERKVLHIENSAFGKCRSLRKVIVCSISTKLGFGAFTYCKGLIFVELPEGLQEIESRLFLGCESLTTVKIPSSVIKIGDSAFNGCRSLTSFDLPHGLLHIAGASFCGCRSIETLRIPVTVTSIGESAFGYCTSLKYITLPPTLETLEMFAFEGCRRLEYIVFPTTLKNIGSGVFEECSTLSHIRIPPSVDVIEDGAFMGCTSLISMELPESEFLFDIDLSSYDSLVNIAGPMLNVQVESMDSFMQNSKLGSVVDGCDDVVRYNDLVRRFSIDSMILL